MLEAREHMIDGQLLTNGVLHPGILAAMYAVPREHFMPTELAGSAYVDEDISLRRERFLIAPLALAKLLQLAEIEPDENVLDIGCATGYSVAVISQLAETVVGVEQDHELASHARKLLSQQKYLNEEIVTSAMTVGYATAAPYDAIILQGAVQHVPEELTTQLAEDGRMVGVRCLSLRPGREKCGLGRAFVLKKREGRLHMHDEFDVSLPLLSGFERRQGFEF